MYQFKIGVKYTSDDWGLLLSSFEIGEASVKTNYINLPGGDGSIDLTEALTGDVSYGDREIKAKFIIIDARSTWQATMDQVRACHGRKFAIVAPNDPDHYFIGRVSIGPLIKENSSASFDMTIVCEPWRYKNDVTVYDFTMGVTGTLTTSLVNGRKRVLPTVTVSHTTQVIFGLTSASLGAGTHVLTSVVLVEGNNSITFNAAQGATINVQYQEGVL